MRSTPEPTDVAALATLPERVALEGWLSTGAIMTVTVPVTLQVLVSYFVWLEAGRAYWFEAKDDSSCEAHVLVFDETHLVEHLGICFLNEGQPVGYLCGIEQAGLEDAGNYHAAWDKWKQGAPVPATYIESSGASMA